MTGVAGVGKTRVALQVAGAVTSEFASIAWAPLATVGDAREVGKAVLDAIGRRERTRGEAHACVQAESHLLLILDNCEHVIDGCADLVEGLLQTFATVRVLATSREPLGVPGEVVVPIAPLPLPRADDPLDDLIQNDAVELFVQRARAREPQFQLTHASAELVARICRSLDGIPLAIELAAARVTTRTVADIATGLEDPLELLTNGLLTNPRHQTLRASLDWSHALLQESERRVLRRISIFDGGFTSNAAARVCATEGLPAAEVPALLEGLVAKSLVHASQQEGTVRFGIFHAVRSYGLALLRDAGEEHVVRDLHVQWCLSDIEHIGSVETPQGDERQHLEREEKNLRAALDWTMQQSQCIESARLTLVLGRLWQLSGRWPEGVRSLTGTTASQAPTGLGCDPWRAPHPTTQNLICAVADSMPVTALDACPGMDEAGSAADGARTWIAAACAENQAVDGKRSPATLRLVEPTSAGFASWPVGPATHRQVSPGNGQHHRREPSKAGDVEPGRDGDAAKLAEDIEVPPHTEPEKPHEQFEAMPLAAVQKDQRPRSCALSERELEVVKLVAEGRSNREIAEELIIARKTAEAHVSHILTKLGLWRRVQIATWSMQQGQGSTAAG